MLESVRLVNCQSIKDITFKFSTERLNVIAANNSVGKSVLFKMLKITADPRQLSTIEERSQLIRHGEAKALMMAAFSDGAIGMTIVLPNQVMYRYAKIPELGFESFTEPPEEYLKQLGLHVDKRTKYVATIIDTEQDMLFINSDQRGNDALLQLIAENPILAHEKERLTSLESVSSKLMLNTNAALLDCQQNLRNFKYVDETRLEEEIECGNAISTILKDLIQLNRYVDAIETYVRDFLNYDQYITIIDVLLQLQSIQMKTGDIQADCDNALQIITGLQQLVNIQLVLDSIQVCSDSVDVDALISLINTLGNIDYCQKKICSTSVIDSSVPESLKILSNLSYNVRNLTNATANLCNIDARIEQVIEEIQECGEELSCPVHGKVVYDGKQCIPYSF